MAEVTRLMMSSKVDQSVTSKLVDHLTQRSAAPRQFQFVNIPQHQITKPELSSPLPQMAQLSTPQMPQLPFIPQFSTYPSPPNSPESCPSPVALPQRLPSVARRPQPQRAHAVWRPWWMVEWSELWWSREDGPLSDEISGDYLVAWEILLVGLSLHVLMYGTLQAEGKYRNLPLAFRSTSN